MAMNWSDVGKSLLDKAPGIGLALGGPGGAALGTILSSVFGSGDSPDAVAAAINADPAAAVKLREVQLQHEGLIATLAKDQYLAMLTDVQDARKQHKDHWMPSVITLTLVVMVTVMLYGLITVTIPDGNRDVVYLIGGQVISAFTGCIAYWIGTSRGSLVKNGWAKGDKS